MRQSVLSGHVCLKQMSYAFGSDGSLRVNAFWLGSK